MTPEQRATLLALADRVEALTGPCRETDAAIALAFNLYDQPEDLGCFVDLAEAVVGGGGQTWQTWAPPTYTASIDAAMTLVPEGWRWYDYHWPRKDEPKRITLVTNAPHGNIAHGRAATLALALTAAALRAQAAA